MCEWKELIKPFPLHALDDGAGIIAIRIGSEQYGFACLDRTAVHNAINDCPDVWDRPDIRY